MTMEALAVRHIVNFLFRASGQDSVVCEDCGKPIDRVENATTNVCQACWDDRGCSYEEAWDD